MVDPVDNRGMDLPSILRRTAVLLAASAAAAGLTAGTGRAATSCDRYAAPNGSDSSGDGSLSQPYATLRHLDARLAPGQTGCLRGGTYGNVHTWQDLATNGTAGHPITVTAAPGEHVKLIGYVDMEGAYTTLSGMEIDGSNTLLDQDRPGIPCPSHGISDALAIYGRGDVFEDNELYQSQPALRSTGIGIGFLGSAPADVVVRRNRIHDVGQCLDLDQAIYLASGRGAQIYDNWIWNVPHGWGIQVYPQAQQAHIFDNVIDRAGSGFTLGGERVTSGNQIDHNIVTNSTGLPSAHLYQGVAINDYWESAPGAGNRFTQNLSFNNPGGVARVTEVRVASTVSAAPRFVDRATHDYRLLSGSPAAAWGMWDGSSAQPAPAARVTHRGHVRHRRHPRRSRARRR